MVTTEAALDDALCHPTPGVVEALGRVEGDVVVLGAGGKMGPTLARMALRAAREAGAARRVVAVSRYGDPAIRAGLERAGVETVAGDLFDHRLRAALPEAAGVLYLAGQKFGTTEDPARTWAVNTVLPALVAERYAGARIVAFSTGNVYPLWPLGSDGPTETDPVAPIGEYAQSALARERVLEFISRRHGTPMALLRLNYAVEPRYGVLRDVAEQVREGRPVSLAMGAVNLIWQRDANAVALRMLEHCTVPPFVLNVTGRPAVRVRWIAEQFGRRWGVEPRFRDEEAATALLSNARRCEQLFGAPETGIEAMIDLVADWVERGGRSLGKPTHFESREGAF